MRLNHVVLTLKTLKPLTPYFHLRTAVLRLTRAKKPSLGMFFYSPEKSQEKKILTIKTPDFLKAMFLERQETQTFLENSSKWHFLLFLTLAAPGDTELYKDLPTRHPFGGN